MCRGLTGEARISLWSLGANATLILDTLMIPAYLSPGDAAVTLVHTQHAECIVQVPEMRGPRIVMVPDSGISEAGLDALGRALSQHPRMLFFAINISRRKEEDVRRIDGKPLHLLSSKQRSSSNL